MKLYLKKLLFTILFSVLLLMISYILSLSHHVIPLKDDTVYTMSIIIGLVIMLFFTYAIRLCGKKAKARYLSEKQPKKNSLEKEFYKVLRSKENVIHMIAFLTIIDVFFICVALSVGSTIATAAGKILILSLVGGIVFTLLNTLIFCMVHKRWCKGCKNKKKPR